MKIVGVIQARMGSTRLPGKVLMPLAGRPLVAHIRDRVARVGAVSDVVVATTTDPRNDALAAWAADEGMICVRHEAEDDIAGRMAAVFDATGADAILKCNGDCPVLDVDLLAWMVARFVAEGDLDYLSNKVVFTCPMGMSVEVIAAAPFRWCDANLSDPGERELVCDYIRDHPARFSVAGIQADRDLSHIGMMVDTRADYEEVSDLFDRLYTANPIFGLAEILPFLGLPGDRPEFTFERVTAT